MASEAHLILRLSKADRSWIRGVARRAAVDVSTHLRATTRTLRALSLLVDDIDGGLDRKHATLVAARRAYLRAERFLARTPGGPRPRGRS